MTQTKKANTLMEKFGFMDPDLTTPKHDALMVWLDQNVESILLSRYPAVWNPDGLSKLISSATLSVEELKNNVRRAIIECEEKVSSHPVPTNTNESLSFLLRSTIEPHRKEALDRYKARLNFYDNWTLGDAPQKSVKFIGKEWEKPISTRTGYTVGFVDMVASINVSKLNLTEDDNKLPVWDLWDKVYSCFFEVKPSIQSVGEVIRQVRLYQQHVDNGEWFIVSPDDRFAKAFEDQGIGFIKVPSEKITLQNNAPPADMLAFIKQVFEKMEARGQCVNPEWQGWLQRNAG